MPRAPEAWKATLAYQAKFWERWSDEYLQMLRERSQWTHRAPRLENSTSPKVGEVVLLHDNLRPKNLWKMGRIAQVFETPNGIRTAKVFMGKDSILTRPVNKLYSLELTRQQSSLLLTPLKSSLTTQTSSSCIQTNRTQFSTTSNI
ncbi:hypothetical protein DdX_20728 [Ditylenchus destructor]|uniref:DUF5641 domain-containing protein n=1 Tax=Ditylenchus destructor TaxID=166010 RepID=A0AAD4MGR3_9BILA|nr:hypothetical protein DdX_20728 [Ditylenchus destructor]